MWNAPAVIGLSGRDKTQEATSITTALVLAANDRIFCPHKPHQRNQWAEPTRTGKPTTPNVPRIECASKQNAANGQQQGDRNRNRFPDRPTNNAAHGVSFTSFSRHPPFTSSRKVA